MKKFFFKKKKKIGKYGKCRKFSDLKNKKKKKKKKKTFIQQEFKWEKKKMNYLSITNDGIIITDRSFNYYEKNY